MAARHTWVVTFLAMLLLSGCKTYDERLAEISGDYYENRLDMAMTKMYVLVQEVEKDDVNDLPLYKMERAIIATRMGNYKAASEDLKDAYSQTEVLDLTSDPEAAEKYLFRDYSGKYKVLPYEEVIHNTINGINFLAMGDLNGAAVEFRQFQTQSQYWTETEGEKDCQNPIGYYLGALVMQKIGDRGNLDYFQKQAKKCSLIPASFYELSTSKDKGDLLVVVLNGKAPCRVEERKQLLEADIAVRLGKYRGSVAPPMMRYAKLATRSATYSGISEVSADDQKVQAIRLLDIEAQATARYKKEETQIITAATSRAVTRAIAAYIAAEAVRESMRNQKDHDDDAMAGLCGVLAGTAVEAGMAAADTPDTRCWSFLPRDIYIAKLQLTPGSKQVRIVFEGGNVREKTVDLNGGELKTIVLVEP